MRSRLPGARIILLACALLWAAATAGCVTAGSYIVTLRDGRVYRSAQPPLLDSKTGYYKFRDRYGRDVLLRDRDVATITKDPAS